MSRYFRATFRLRVYIVANPASLRSMAELRLVDLSATTVEAVNNLSLKPGQEDFLAPESYEVAASDVDPQTMWQRVVLDGDAVVGFISANFDANTPQEHLRSVLWRINVDADDQGRGIGRFAVAKLLEEARAQGVPAVNVIYAAGKGGPQAFFERVGFTPVGETEYGEVVAEIRL